MHTRYRKYHYPIRGSLAAKPGKHGELSAIVTRLPSGWCWEVQEDRQTIFHGEQPALDDAMAGARYKLDVRQGLVEDGDRSYFQHQNGNPDAWRREDR